MGALSFFCCFYTSSCFVKKKKKKKKTVYCMAYADGIVQCMAYADGIVQTVEVSVWPMRMGLADLLKRRCLYPGKSAPSQISARE